jgi:hypothetical protein
MIQFSVDLETLVEYVCLQAILIDSHPYSSTSLVRLFSKAATDRSIMETVTPRD